jgi:hypothetical protein
VNRTRTQLSGGSGPIAGVPQRLKVVFALDAGSGPLHEVFWILVNQALSSGIEQAFASEKDPATPQTQRFSGQ